MKLLKHLIKSIIRALVYGRLRWLELSETSALRWANLMKRWPGIFAESPFLKVRVVDHGAKMRLGIIDVIERQLLLTGTWEPDIADLMRREIKPGMTVVDVGANIGYFALLAATEVGTEGRVIAVEPSHRNLTRLTENLWINKASNTIVLSIAAGFEAGFASLAFPTYNNAGAATLRRVSTIQEQRVTQLKLDDVLDLLQVSPGLIKVDVEGYELEVLKGMRKTLMRHHPPVICELTESFLSEMGQSARELVSFMESCGYSCELIPKSRVSGSTEIRSDDKELPSTQVDVIFRLAA